METLMKRIVFITLVLILSGVATFAQTSPTPQQGADKKATYDELLAKLKAGDTSIDFRALRISYTETKQYSPYGTDSEQRRKLFKAVNDKKYKDALKVADEILDTNYVDMNAHMGASISYRELGDETKAEFHKAVFRGLVESILNGADGKSPQTAYVVICVPEEYVIVNYLGYQRGSQALVNKEGHQFDVLTVTDPDRGKSVELYFNIDFVWKGYDKIFGK